MEKTHEAASICHVSILVFQDHRSAESQRRDEGRQGPGPPSVKFGLVRPGGGSSERPEVAVGALSELELLTCPLRLKCSCLLS